MNANCADLSQLLFSERPTAPCGTAWPPRLIFLLLIIPWLKSEQEEAGVC